MNYNYQQSIYRTRIEKYGLSFLLFLLDTPLDYTPNILVRYNGLYLCSRLHRHLVLGYYIEPEYILLHEEANIQNKQSILYSENLIDIYSVYYETYKNREFANPKPRIYNILKQEIVFSKGWFEYSDNAFVLEFNTLLYQYQSLGISGMIELFVALKDLTSAYCYTDHNWSSMAMWIIKEYLFDQLPTRFTIDDVIPIVIKDVENRAYNSEKMWCDIAELHNRHKNVTIPIVSKKEYKEIGYYIEKPTKYGIYHGECVWYN